MHKVYKTVDPDIALMIENLQEKNAQLQAALKELFNMAKAYIPDPRQQDYNLLNESEEEWAIGMTYQKTEQVLATSGGMEDKQ